MTATEHAPVTAPHASPEQSAATTGLVRAARSEWTKLRTVRSTWWCVGVGIAGMAVYAAFMGFSMASSIADDPVTAEDYSPVQVTSQGVFYLLQFTVVVLGALAGAGEYVNRGITATLRWIPGRGRLLTARALVTAAVAFVTGVAATAAATGVTAAFVGPEIGVEVADSVRTCLSVGTCMALFAALFVGVGTALRGVAGTIVTGFLLLLGLPLVLQLSDVRILNDLAGYLPGLAGIEFYAAGDVGFYTAPHDGVINVASVIGWVAAALIVGYAEMRGRDA